MANAITSSASPPAVTGTTAKPAAEEKSKAANAKSSSNCTHQTSSRPPITSQTNEQIGDQKPQSNAKFALHRPRTSRDAEAANSIAPAQKLPGEKLPGDDGRENVERWRRETEDLARQSAEALDDQRSLGYHIKVWHHARKVDQQRGGAAHLTSGVFDILNELTRRRHEADSPRPQGKIWTLRTRKWFDENGFPLLVKADEAEIEAVRAALANDFGGMR